MSNPSSNDVFSQFMLDLQTSSQAVPGMVAAQVLIGPLEHHCKDNFYHSVAENGYYLIIEPPKAEGSFWNYEGTFTLSAFLFYPVPADVTYNWLATNAQIAALIAGWAHWTAPGGSEWVAGQNRSPVTFRMDKPLIRHYIKPLSAFLGDIQGYVVSNRFVFTMPMIVDQCANPYIMPPT